MLTHTARFGRNFMGVLADQFAAQHLANETARELFDKNDQLRHLAGRQAALAKGNNRLSRNPRLLLKADEGDGLIGNSHDDHFAHFGQLVDDLFHVAGKGRGRFVVGPHILAAADDLEVAIFIHAGDVVGVQPAFFVDDGTGGGLILPVALHDLRAAHNQFTYLPWLERRAAFEADDAGFGAGQWQTDGSRLCYGR